MQAGKLKHRLVIKYIASETANTLGELTKVWGTRATVWGSIDPLSAREAIAAQTTLSETSHKATIRYLSTVTIKDTIEYGTRTFNINGIINTGEKNKELILLCSENT